jgi:hypothetical protein
VWGRLRAHGDILLVEWGMKAVICVIDDVVEFICASCRELEMGEMIYVFPLPAVGVNDSLNLPPRSFSRVHMSPRPLSSMKEMEWLRVWGV